MTELPPWTIPQFARYVEIALETMAKRGLVNIDGVPICPVTGADGSLRVEIAADLTAMGLRDGVPITARTQVGGPVAWSLGNLLLAVIPGEYTPEEAGEKIGASQIRMAYRQWAEQNRSGSREQGHGNRGR